MTCVNIIIIKRINRLFIKEVYKCLVLGMPELLIILVIILIIFGAGKLPQIGKGLGQGGIKNFRDSTKSTKESPEEIPEDIDNNK